MIVQATNTGTDVSSTQFDIAVSSRPNPNRENSNRLRCLAVGSESSMGALPSGEPRRRSGELSTVVLHLTLALNSRRSSNLAVSSGGAGSRAPITQREPSPLIPNWNPLISSLVSITALFPALLKLLASRAAL